MSPPRLVDLHGVVSACDAAGRRVSIHFDGAALRIDAGSMRAVWSAFLSLRASGAIDGMPASLLDRLNDFRIEICIRGELVGRAGAGARASWVGRALTKLPLELRIPALLRAAVRSY